MLLRLAGRDVSLAEIKEALPLRNDKGYSLAELQTAAGQFGLGLTGIRLDERDLPLSHPAIAFLYTAGEGHFIVLRPVGRTGKVVQVIDPPSAPAILDYQKLLSSSGWTGRMLVRQSASEWFFSRIWLIIPLLMVLALAYLVRRRIKLRWR